MVLDVYTYFAVGFFYDVLITLYYISINEKRPVYAGIMSFVITFVQLYVMYNIIVSSEVLMDVLSFSLGCAAGTYVTILLSKTKKLGDLHWTWKHFTIWLRPASQLSKMNSSKKNS